ncbi:MAG: hypothetical protein A3D74_00625 [Candidatus Levybacteria bacterium RIFCSPHIGHO2_02_FULL_37_13]|nr:MAG: hypothetical protein A3D74_00625 [Candidatus Levybacteria bacterium RIFCSPHIGHO2_02_FULL_37_13]
MEKKIFKKSKIKSKSKQFFKKKEKLSRSLQFPNIFRSFTERYFLTLLVSFVLVIILAIVGLDLYKDVLEQKKIETERKETISKIEYWQKIVDKYKDYRDAYFQLAILEYRLKNFDKSKYYLNKVLSIDPNFENGRDMEQILNSL